MTVCNGFGGTKGFFVPPIAKLLSRHGIAVLTFDYRGFGNSEGERGRLFPLEQVADVDSAVTWLSQQVEFDADRLGLLGVSYGGGIALAAAAQLRWVRAAACVAGVADSQAWMRDLRRYWEWYELKRELQEDRIKRATTGSSRRVDVSDILVRDPAAAKRDATFRQQYPERTWSISLESVDSILEFRPIDFLENLGAMPTFFVGLVDDLLTPFEQTQKLFEAARGPKELMKLRGIAHYDMYEDPHLETIMERFVSFFQAAID